MKKAVNTILLLTIISSFNLHADELKESNPWYFGFGIGQNTYEISDNDSQVNTDISENAWEFNAGYQVTSNLGFEVGYRDLGENKLQYISGKALTFSLFGQLPIKDNWSLVGEFGAVDQILPNNLPSGKTPFFGIGASYTFSDNLSILAIYRRYNNLEGQSEVLNTVESNYTGLKLIYRLKDKNKDIKTIEMESKNNRSSVIAKQNNIQEILLNEKTNIKEEKKHKPKTTLKPTSLVVNKSHLNKTEPNIIKQEVIKPKIITPEITKPKINNSKSNILLTVEKNNTEINNEIDNNVGKVKEEKLKTFTHNQTYIIRFDFDSAMLNQVAINKIKQIAKYVNSNKDVKVKLHGYSSLVGNPIYNLKLSIQRAKNVKNYLYHEYKMPLEKMTVFAHGETMALIEDTSDEANTINQRVEIKIFTYDGKDNDKKGSISTRKKTYSEIIKNLSPFNTSHSVSVIETNNSDKMMLIDGKFSVNSAKMDSELHAYINQLAEFMLDNSTATLELEGHASVMGDDKYNYDLSHRRIKTISDKLIAMGIDAKRINIEVHGETKPLINGDTKLANKMNQRIFAFASV